MNISRISKPRCANLSRPSDSPPGPRISRILCLTLALAALCGCSSIGAKPWERDLMAKREMQIDPYPLQTAAMEHIYFSKEASSGGRGFAGGGCGCGS